MTYVHPELRYAYDALEPYIDAETMNIHHTKHHAAYVKRLESLSGRTPGDRNNASLHSLLGDMHKNTAILEEDRKTLEEGGGGHYNHSLFWLYMCPDASEGKMSDLLKSRIDNDFGSVAAFKEQFGKAAMTVFGSGWCWWVYNTRENKSSITVTKNQLNPIMDDEKNVCLLGLDVWEHAYYLKYHNLKGDYIKHWWSVVDWETVSRIHDEIAINDKPLALSNQGHILFD